MIDKKNVKKNRPHKGKAIKFDLGKPQVSLVPQEALLGCARIMTHGAKKYDAHNWCKGFSFSKLYDAIFRHLISSVLGEDIDPDSKEDPLLHIMADAGMLYEIKRYYPELDDRWKWKNVKKRQKSSKKLLSPKKGRKPRLLSSKKTQKRRKNK